MKKVLLGLFMASSLLALKPQAAEAVGNNCFVGDPQDYYANVRQTPNGKVINGLRNGRKVFIQDTKYDSKGRPWYYLTGWYNGEYRYWGWVIYWSVDCY